MFLELLLADLIAFLIPLFLKYLASCVILPHLVLILPLSLATSNTLVNLHIKAMMFLLVAGSTPQLNIEFFVLQQTHYYVCLENGW